MIKKTLYFGNPAYLSLSKNQLVVKLPEVENAKNVAETIRKESVRTIPIEDIGVVVLDHRQITLTQGLMAALLNNQTAVITCDAHRMPAGLLLPLEGNTLQSERFRSQMEASLPLKKQLWQQTMVAKIENQAYLLEQQLNAPVPRMHYLAETVKSGDNTNCEAQAAAYYWQHLFPALPDFTRGREGPPPNSLLNYGYAILRAVVARALVASGLLPVAGIHHHNRYNAYCLADDIMEPYRPFVDALVIETVQRFGLAAELTTDLKREMLAVPVLDVYMQGKRSPLMVAVAQTTASLAKCYRGEVRKISYPAFH